MGMAKDETIWGEKKMIVEQEIAWKRENTIWDKGLEFRDVAEHRNGYLGFILTEVINRVFRVYKAGLTIIHKRAGDAVVILWHNL